MDVELRQMKLRLSENKTIRAALRARKRFQTDERGDKLVLQFDGKDFEFRPGITLIVGETVGQCLVRESLIIAGDNDLIDPQLPAVEALGTYTVGDPGAEKREGTYCNSCEKDFHSWDRMQVHIDEVHRRATMLKPGVPGVEELTTNESSQ